MSNGEYAWILCKDRNPEKEGRYLVTKEIYFIPDHVDEEDHYTGVDIAYYSFEFGWLAQDVFAWMPLPEICRNI